MKVDVRKVKSKSVENNGKPKETERKEKQHTYKIYNYLKKNPAVFVGTGTTFIAILSALLTFCNYMYECAVLKYWGIEPAHISINSANRLYETIAAFIFISVLFVILFVMDVIAEKTGSIRENILYLKKIKSKHRNEVLKIRLQKTILCHFVKTKSNLSEDHVNRAQNAIEQLEKEINEKKKDVNSQTLAHLFLFSIVLTTSMWILLCVGIAESSDTIITSVIASVIASFITVEVLYITTRNTFVNKKGIKGKAGDDYANQNIQTDVPTISLPLKRILSGEYSIKYPDHKIKRVLSKSLLIVIIVIAALVLSFYFLGYEHALNRTCFMITTQDGIECAVIYNNGDNVIVAPCRATGDILIVDSSFQRALSIEGLKFEVRQYRKAKLGSIFDDTGEDTSSSSVSINKTSK